MENKKEEKKKRTISEKTVIKYMTELKKEKKKIYS